MHGADPAGVHGCRSTQRRNAYPDGRGIQLYDGMDVRQYLAGIESLERDLDRIESEARGNAAGILNIRSENL